MIARILVAIALGLIVWGLSWLIGVGIALIAPLAPLGAAVQSVAWIFGIAAGVIYLVTGVNIFDGKRTGV